MDQCHLLLLMTGLLWHPTMSSVHMQSQKVVEFPLNQSYGFLWTTKPPGESPMAIITQVGAISVGGLNRAYGNIYIYKL